MASHWGVSGATRIRFLQDKGRFRLDIGEISSPRRVVSLWHSLPMGVPIPAGF